MRRGANPADPPAGGGGASPPPRAARAAGRVTLLGPQRLQPTLQPTLASLGLGAGRIATITAGWQERESDDAELHAHLGRRSCNLRLYDRAERVFHRDRDLAAAHHDRQRRLRELQDLYNVRLDHAMAAAHELLRRPGQSDLLQAERAAAIAAVRDLDARHLERVREIHAEMEARWRPIERESVQAERRDIEAALRDGVALAIAGGHVAVLLNRLRLFGLAELAGALPVVAWSAGAMVVSERIVLFHDQPAHGMGHAEVLETGLGLCADIVPLPHARRRLQLDEPVRVALFATRFAPAACVPMNEGARVDLGDDGCTAPDGTVRLLPDGTLGALGAA